MGHDDHNADRVLRLYRLDCLRQGVPGQAHGRGCDDCRHSHRGRGDHLHHRHYRDLRASCQYRVRRDEGRSYPGGLQVMRNYKHILAGLGLALLAGGALAAGADLGQVEKQATNWTAITMFAIFVAGTMFITKWAASKTKSAADFYTAGGGITGFQNGLAIAGDYMSAASFLGVSAAVMANGYDGLIYSIGFLVGWPLIAQLVGAGQLITLLFGLDYWMAVVIVGALMMVYVLFGGMPATTWVQIIKACLLLAGASFMAFMGMKNFGFSPEAMFAKAVEIKIGLATAAGKTPDEAAKLGQSIMGPGTFVKDPISAISFGMALMFGTADLPHILMRFFTVPDAKEARKSVFWATTWIGYFYILTFIIGFGAITFVLTNPEFLDTKNALKGGGNMAAIHLANAVGGNVFLGFISAVAFATILAVVAGLTLSGASAVSHDLYATVFKHGNADSASELRVSRMTTIALGVIAVILGIAFEKQNIAFMVSLAFAIAASANFPVLFMSVLWKNCTTRGAAIGGFIGLITAVVLTVLSKSVWVDVLQMAKDPIFPYTSPCLFSMTAGFLGIWLFSVLDGSEQAKKEKLLYEAQKVRSETGIGAAGASGH